jgi:hypothetical protein
MRRFTITDAGLTTSFSYNFGGGATLSLAPLRTVPSVSRLRNIYSSGKLIAQYTTNTIWIFFDLASLPNPNSFFIALYKICYGTVPNAGATLEDCLAVQSNSIQELNRIPAYYEADQPTQQDRELHRNPTAQTAEPVAPTTHRSSNRRPQETEGRGIDWVQQVSAPTSSIPVSDLTKLVTEIQKKSKERADRRKSELESEIKYKDQDRVRLLTNILKLEEELSLLHISLAAIETVKDPLALRKEQEELQMLELQSIVDTYYVSVYLEGNDVIGITKSIIATQEGVMTADIGQFKVRISQSDVTYERLDGRRAKRQLQGTSAFCHHTDSSICWGTYRNDVYRLAREKNYAQVLLLVAHHLSSVTPHDHYISLPSYCQKLRIKRVIDLVKGETEFPVDATEEQKPPQPSRAAEVRVESVVQDLGNGVTSRPLTPEELAELGIDASSFDLSTDPEEGSVE